MADPLPLYLSVDGVYDAKEMSLPWADALGEGVIFGGVPAGLDPLKVNPISPAGMGVEIAPGAAWVRNDRTTDSEAYYEGGLWRVTRPTSFQLPITPADPTNPRIDRVGLEVLDKQFGAAQDIGRYRAVAGTPGASPAAPAEPRSFLTLALVTVPAAASSIVVGNIADGRVRSATPRVGVPYVGFDSQRLAGTNRADGASVVVVTDQTIFASGWTFTANQWRCDVPGLYLVYCSFGWTQSGTGARYVLVRKNGAALSPSISDQRQAAGSNRFTYMGAAAFARFIAGDLLDLQARQDSGAALAEATDGSIRLGAWRLAL